MSNSIPSFKDKAVLTGWIAGILIAISLLWILSRPLHAQYLMRAVNRTLAASGDSRSLEEPIYQSSNQSPFSFWYSITESTDNMYVFAVIRDGILIPCGAIVSPNGKVIEIIALSTHARAQIKNLPQSIMQIYIRHIEAAAGNQESSRFQKGGER